MATPCKSEKLLWDQQLHKRRTCLDSSEGLTQQGATQLGKSCCLNNLCGAEQQPVSSCVRQVTFVHNNLMLIKLIVWYLGQ